MHRRTDRSGDRSGAVRISAALLLAAGVFALPLSAVGKPAPAKPSAAGTAPARATAPSAGTASLSAKAADEATLPQSRVPPFAQVDTNHDGKIEWKEAQAVKVPKKIFDQFDFNKNGTLSQTEWLFVRLHMTDFAPPKASSGKAGAAGH